MNTTDCVSSVLGHGTRRLWARFLSEHPRKVKTEKGRVGFIEPLLAVAVTKLPEGPAWAYELKFDGYRVIGMKAAGQVRLFSRNGKTSPNVSLRSREHWKHSLTIP
jgi:ATP-dependent DNA ligase